MNPELGKTDRPHFIILFNFARNPELWRALVSFSLNRSLYFWECNLFVFASFHLGGREGKSLCMVPLAGQCLIRTLFDRSIVYSPVASVSCLQRFELEVKI